MTENNDLIRIFENDQFGNVRVVIRDDEPWFVAADVCRALDVGNPSQALTRLDEDEKMTTLISNEGAASGKSSMAFVNEPGLYALVLSSRKKEARAFKRWITHEVIPDIRKHGMYMTSSIVQQVVGNPRAFAELALAYADEKDRRAAAERKIEEQKPLVQFANHVADTSDLIDMGDFAKLAKDEHIDIGRNRLFAWLRNEGYLMDDNAPYQRYVEQGIFVLREGSYDTPYGSRIYKKTYVTGKGQIYLIEKLRKAYLILKGGSLNGGKE